MGGSLLSVLEGVPGYDGYMAAKKRQEDSQLSQLKQASVLMGLQSAMQKQAREQEMRQALAAAKTPEEQLAVATRYAGPEGIMKHADRQAQIKSTNESVRARLEQKAGDFDRSMALKYAQLDQAERMGADRNNIARYRAMLDAADKAFKQQLAQEHLRLTGAAASYNVGAAAPNIPDLNVPAAPVAPAVAPSTGTALPPNVPESDAAAFLAAKAGGSATVNRQVTPDEQARMVQMPGAPEPQAAPVSVALTPVAPSAPMADASNLDARDLRARAATTAPAPAAATPPAPTMPQFVGSPKQQADARNKWLAAQAKGGEAGGEAVDAVVNAIVEGRMQVPSSFALRSPYWKDVIERVVKKDPNFDASKYGARAAARRTFASGPEARNVTALNTVIGHLGTLDEAASALQNGDIRAFNAVANRLATETGDPRVQNFDTAKQAVAEETMRVFRQVGASELEARMWGERITSSGSPAQLRGVVATLGELLESRVEAIGQQYERSVNNTGNPAQVDPKNKEKLDRLRKGGASDIEERLKRYR